MSGMSFEEWKAKVASVLSRRGIRIDEIPESDLQQAFGDGETPIVFANQFERIGSDPVSLPRVDVRSIRFVVLSLRIVAILNIIVNPITIYITTNIQSEIAGQLITRVSRSTLSFTSFAPPFLNAMAVSAALYALSVLVLLAWKATGGKSIQ